MTQTQITFYLSLAGIIALAILGAVHRVCIAVERVFPGTRFDKIARTVDAFSTAIQDAAPPSATITTTATATPAAPEGTAK